MASACATLRYRVIIDLGPIQTMLEGIEVDASVYRDLKEEPVEINRDFSNVIVVDGIPAAPVSKYEKLVGYTTKLFSKHAPLQEDGVFLPVDDEGKKTLGFAFISFETTEDAEMVASKGEIPFDKRSNVSLHRWGDFERYASIASEEYKPPAASEYDTHGQVTSWLLDERCRDQYVLRYSDETEIYWNDPIKGGNELAYGGESQKEGQKVWTELYVRWSPEGSFLTTFHQPGVALWGGESFRRINKFAHSDVQLISFSPNAKYLMTFNGVDSPSPTDPSCFIFWDVRSGQKLRGLEGGESLTRGTWPIFKWSFDSKYVARIMNESLYIYELPSMTLLDKKSVKIEGIQDFEWSPSQNIISYWTPECENIPASVSLMSVPEKQVIREKHLFQVHGVRMFWQSAGEFLCVKVAREKKGKFQSNNFEIFRMFEKNIPIEVLEIADKVGDFAWEPLGKRFAFSHEESASSTSVSLYTMKKTKIKHEHTIKDQMINTLSWSPGGDYLVLAAIGGSNSGDLEFFDAKTKKSLGVQNHHGVTEIQWDPTGRYLCSIVCQPLKSGESWRFAMNNGFKIWSCQGELLVENAMDDLYQFIWRPRPACLLSVDQLKEIKGNLRNKYYKIFDEEDQIIRESQLVGAERKAAEAKAAWKKFRQEVEAEFRKHNEERNKLRGIVADDGDEWEEIENVVEEEISVKEEIIG